MFLIKDSTFDLLLLFVEKTELRAALEPLAPVPKSPKAKIKGTKNPTMLITKLKSAT